MNAIKAWRFFFLFFFVEAGGVIQGVFVNRNKSMF